MLATQSAKFNKIVIIIFNGKASVPDTLGTRARGDLFCLLN